MLSFRDNIVFIIAKAHQRAQGALKTNLQSQGLTPMQCLIIEVLWEEEGIPVGDIGRKLSIDTATLAGVLDRMVTAGWIRREVDRDDGRVARIYRTDKANAIIADLAASIEKTNDLLLNALSLDQKGQLKDLLREIRA